MNASPQCRPLIAHGEMGLFQHGVAPVAFYTSPPLITVSVSVDGHPSYLNPLPTFPQSTTYMWYTPPLPTSVSNMGVPCTNIGTYTLVGSIPQYSQTLELSGESPLQQSSEPCLGEEEVISPVWQQGVSMLYPLGNIPATFLPPPPSAQQEMTQLPTELPFSTELTTPYQEELESVDVTTSSSFEHPEEDFSLLTTTYDENFEPETEPVDTFPNQASDSNMNPVEQISLSSIIEDGKTFIACPWTEELPDNYPDPRGAFCKMMPVNRRGRKRAAEKSKKMNLCAFCKSNKETHQYCISHQLKDSSGNVTCPVLSQLVCPICGNTGTAAHTLRYCPQVSRDPGGKPFYTNKFKICRNSAGNKQFLKL